MKKFKSKKLVLLVLVVACVCVAGVFIVREFFSQEAVVEREKGQLPSAVAEEELRIKNQELSKTPEILRTTQNDQRNTGLIPPELNLDVPFTAQAPTANWDYTHEEACEEAAILMVGRYFRGEKIENTDDAEQGIQEIIAWENKNLGFFESTTVEESARAINEIYGLKTEIVENPTTDQIKAVIADDKLILVPAAGRELHNPFYKSPGPLYHMLLIKGYTKDQFITNDAGTKRGENFPYDFKTVLDANRDWNDGDVANGAKKIIIVSK